MRYVSGLLLGTAAAAHTGALTYVIGLGLLVGLGVVSALFAVEAMIKEAMRPPPPRMLMPAITEDELHRVKLNQDRHYQTPPKERP